jgi:hypothetical protein
LLLAIISALSSAKAFQGLSSLHEDESPKGNQIQDFFFMGVWQGVEMDSLKCC